MCSRRRKWKSTALLVAAFRGSALRAGAGGHVAVLLQVDNTLTHRRVHARPID